MYEEYVPEEWAEIQRMEDDMVAQADSAWARYDDAMKKGDNTAAEIAAMEYSKIEHDLYMTGVKYDPRTKERKWLETDEEVFTWSPLLK